MARSGERVRQPFSKGELGSALFGLEKQFLELGGRILLLDGLPTVEVAEMLAVASVDILVAVMSRPSPASGIAFFWSKNDWVV